MTNLEIRLITPICIILGLVLFILILHTAEKLLKRFAAIMQQKPKIQLTPLPKEELPDRIQCRKCLFRYNFPNNMYCKKCLTQDAGSGFFYDSNWEEKERQWQIQNNVK